MRALFEWAVRSRLGLFRGPLFDAPSPSADQQQQLQTPTFIPQTPTPTPSSSSGTNSQSQLLSVSAQYTSMYWYSTVRTTEYIHYSLSVFRPFTFKLTHSLTANQLWSSCAGSGYRVIVAGGGIARADGCRSRRLPHAAAA